MKIKKIIIILIVFFGIIFFDIIINRIVNSTYSLIRHCDNLKIDDKLDVHEKFKDYYIYHDDDGYWNYSVYPGWIVSTPRCDLSVDENNMLKDRNMTDDS